MSKNVINGLLIGLASGAFGILAGATLLNPRQPPAVQAVTSQAEVTDLINRLRPMVKHPDGDWYMSGLAITFYVRTVAIDLEFPGGSRLKSSASTLPGAVAGLSGAPDEVKKALEGWPGQ